MFPQENIDINSIKEKVLSDSKTTGKTFLFDFEKSDFILRDGKLVEVEGVEALKVWIEKIIRTEKFKFKIYENENKDSEYGIRLQDLIVGNNYPLPFIESEIKRELTEALLKHPLIKSLEKLELNREKTILRISFKVVLKSDNTFTQEVIF